MTIHTQRANCLEEVKVNQTIIPTLIKSAHARAHVWVAPVAQITSYSSIGAIILLISLAIV